MPRGLLMVAGSVTCGMGCAPVAVWPTRLTAVSVNQVAPSDAVVIPSGWLPFGIRKPVMAPPLPILAILLVP